MGRNGIDKTLSTKAANQSASVYVHIKGVTGLGGILENSILAETHPDRNGDPGVDAILRFYGAIEIEGKTYRAKTTVKKVKGREEGSYYSYEVQEMELLPERSTEGKGSLNPDRDSSSISMPDLLADAVKSSGEKFGDGTNIGKKAKPKLTGRELYAVYTKVYERYSGLLAAQLERELGLPEGRTFAQASPGEQRTLLKRVARMLEREISSRGYPEALKDSLRVVEESGRPAMEGTLLFDPNRHKFETMLLALVNARLVRHTLPGNAHVSASSEGFARKETLDALTPQQRKGIVWTTKEVPDGLKPTIVQDRDGRPQMTRSQVLVRSHFKYRNSEGKLEYVDLTSDRYSEDILNDRGEAVGRRLREGMIDPEMLSSFSFRTPTSSHQSGAIIEIVGFLPPEMGDIIVVPREHTTQLGEDYDIDKRNVYKSHYLVDHETGKIGKLTAGGWARQQAHGARAETGTVGTVKDPQALLDAMEGGAPEAPVQELTPENWKAAFGNGVQTPVGEAKMGENQYKKLVANNREKEFGMILPTLTDPDVVLEEESPSEDPYSERDSVYLFVKTFTVGGEKVRHYESVTVKRSDREVVISSHIKKEKQVREQLKKDRLLYIATRLNAQRETFLEQPIRENPSDPNANIENVSDTSLEVKLLENALVDTYKTVFSSVDADVQRRVIKPLVTDVAEATAGLMDRLLGEGRDLSHFSPHSDAHQRRLLKMGADGQQGISVHSMAVVLEAQMQRLEESYEDGGHVRDGKVTLTTVVQDGKTGRAKTVLFAVDIGGLRFDGRLGARQRTLDGGRDIADQHAENQNVSTDNVKKQVMGKRNENRHTMDVYALLAHMGVDRSLDTVDTGLEDGRGGTVRERLHVPSLLLNQPIVRDFVAIMDGLDSVTGEYMARKEKVEKTLWKLKEKHGLDLDVEAIKTDPGLFHGIVQETAGGLTGTALWQEMKVGGTAQGQLAVLALFMELKGQAETVSKVRRTANFSSKGLGKSYFEAMQRGALMYWAATEGRANNFHRLVGEMSMEPRPGYRKVGDMYWRPTTIEGTMAVNALSTADRLLAPFFPYGTGDFRLAVQKVLEAGGLDPATGGEAYLRAAQDVMKSMTDFAQSALPLWDGTAHAERTRLLEGGAHNAPLHEVLSKLMNGRHPVMKNAFMQGLSVERNRESGSYEVLHRGGRESRIGGRDLSDALLEMLRSDRTLVDGHGRPMLFRGREMKVSELAQDLVSYSFLTDGRNGATGWRQYAPMAYLKAIGASKALRGAFGEMREGDGSFAELFVEQYFQHNPDRAHKLPKSDESKDLTSAGSVPAISLGRLTVDYTEPGGTARHRLVTLLRPAHDFVTDGLYSLFEEHMKEDNPAPLPEYVGWTGKKSSRLFKRVPQPGSPFAHSYVEIPVVEGNGTRYDMSGRLTPAVLGVSTERLERLRDGGLYVTQNGRGTPLAKMRDVLPQRFRTVSDLLDHIHNADDTSKDIHRLAVELREYVNLGVNLVWSDRTPGGSEMRPLGVYFPGTNAIHIRPDIYEKLHATEKGDWNAMRRHFAEVVLEEVLHSMTVREMQQHFERSDPKTGEVVLKGSAPHYMVRIADLYRAARESVPFDPNDKRTYHSKNIEEFVAGVFTSPEYRGMLEDRRSGFVQRFLNALRDWLKHKVFQMTGRVPSYRAEMFAAVRQLLRDNRDGFGRDGRPWRPPADPDGGDGKAPAPGTEGPAGADLEEIRGTGNLPSERARNPLLERNPPAPAGTERGRAESKNFVSRYTIAEKARVLQGPAVAEVSTEPVPKTGGFKAITDWAAGVFKKQGGKAVSPLLGEVTLSKNSVRDSMAHGDPKNARYAAFAAAKDVIEKGVVTVQAAHDRTESFYVSAPITVDGKENIATVLVHRNPSTQRMYLHSVLLKEDLLDQGVSTADVQDSTSELGSSLGQGGMSSLHDAVHGGKVAPEQVHAVLRELLRYDGAKVGEKTEAQKGVQAVLELAEEVDRQNEKAASERDGGDAFASPHTIGGDGTLHAGPLPRRVTTFAEARAAAREGFVGRPLRNAATGMEAVVSNKNLEKMLSQKAVEKSFNGVAQSMAVANVDTLFERAFYGWKKQERSNDPNLAGVHRFFTTMDFDGRQLLTKLTVKETALEGQQNSLYTVEAVDVDERTPPTVHRTDAATENVLISATSAEGVMIEKSPGAHWKGASADNKVGLTPNTSPGVVMVEQPTAKSWIEAAMREDGIDPKGMDGAVPLARPAEGRDRANIADTSHLDKGWEEEGGFASPHGAVRKSLLQSYSDVLEWKAAQRAEAYARARRLEREVRYRDTAANRAALREAEAVAEGLDGQVRALRGQGERSVFRTVHEDIDAMEAAVRGMDVHDTHAIRSRMDWYAAFADSLDNVHEKEATAVRSRLGGLEVHYRNAVERKALQLLEGDGQVRKLLGNLNSDPRAREQAGKGDGERITVADLLRADHDISVWDKLASGLITNWSADTVVPQFLLNSLMKAANRHENRAISLTERLDRIDARYGRPDRQRLVARDREGNPSRWLVDVFSHRWYDEVKVRGRLLEALRNNWGTEAEGASYRAVWNWHRHNTEVVNFFRLSAVKAVYGGHAEYGRHFAYSDAEMAAYEENLKSVLGPRFGDTVQRVLDKLAKLEEAKAGMDPGDAGHMAELARVDLWGFLDKYLRNDMTSMDGHGHLREGFSDLVFLPKKARRVRRTALHGNMRHSTETVEEATGFYSDEFAEVLADEGLLETWKVYREMAEYISDSYGEETHGRLAWPKMDLRTRELLMQGVQGAVGGSFGKLGRAFHRVAHEAKGIFYSGGEGHTAGDGIVPNKVDRSSKQFADLRRAHMLKGHDHEEATRLADRDLLETFSKDLDAGFRAVMLAVAMHNARTEMEPVARTLLEYYKGVKDAKGRTRDNGIARLDHFVETRILNRPTDRGLENTPLKKKTLLSDLLRWAQDKTAWGRKIAREHGTRLLTDQEKVVFEAYQRMRDGSYAENFRPVSDRIGDESYYFEVATRYREGRAERVYLLDPPPRDGAADERIEHSKKDFDKAFDAYIEAKMDSLGMNLSFASVMDGMLKLQILRGLGMNPESGWFNRIEGMQSIMLMDTTGAYWTEGNADAAKDVLAFANAAKMSKRVMGMLGERGRQIRMFDGFVQRLGGLQERKDEIRRGDGDRGIPGMDISFYDWSVTKPEFKNQGTVILSVLMDEKVLDNEGNEHALFDRETKRFAPFDLDAEGRVVVRPEFSESFSFESEQMQNLMVRASNAVSHSQGNYNHRDIMMVKGNMFGRALMLFRTWLPEAIYQRFGTHRGLVANLAQGRRQREGYYAEAWKTSRTATLSTMMAGAGLSYSILGAAATGGLGIVGAIAMTHFIRRTAGRASVKNDAGTLWTMAEFLKSALIETLNLPSRYLSSVPGMRRLRMANSTFGGERFEGMDADGMRSLRALSRTMAVYLVLLAGKIAMAAALEDEDDDRESRGRMRYNFVQNQFSKAIKALNEFSNPVSFLKDQARIGTLEMLMNLQHTLRHSFIDPDGDRALAAFLKFAPVPKIALNAARGILPWEAKSLHDSFGGEFGYVHDLAKDIDTGGEHSARKKVAEKRRETRKKLAKKYERAAKGTKGKAKAEAVRALVDSEMKEVMPPKDPKETHRDVLKRVGEGKAKRVDRAAERARLRKKLRGMGVSDETVRAMVEKRFP